MNIERNASAQQSVAYLAKELADLNANCIGCSDCKCPCRALAEMALLPDVIINRN